MFAALHGHIEIMEEILALKADVTAVDKRGPYRPHVGCRKWAGEGDDSAIGPRSYG